MGGAVNTGAFSIAAGAAVELLDAAGVNKASIDTGGDLLASIANRLDNGGAPARTLGDGDFLAFPGQVGLVSRTFPYSFQAGNGWVQDRGGILRGSKLLSRIPWNATQILGSATGTNAITSASIGAGGANVWSFITGFSITIGLGVAAGIGVATLSGLGTTLSFQVQGTTTVPFDLAIPFTDPLQASAANTGITLSVPALGATTGAVAVVVWGFQVNLGAM